MITNYKVFENSFNCRFYLFIFVEVNFLGNYSASSKNE